MFERCRYVIAAPHDVPYLQIRRDFHVDAGGPVSGWAIQEIGPKARISDGLVPFAVLLAPVLRDCCNLIRLFAQVAGCHAELHGLVLPVLRGFELNRCWLGPPSWRQIEAHSA